MSQRVKGAACALLLVISTACLRAGVGPVKLIPGAAEIEVVRDSTAVEQCIPLREVRVSDGILRRLRSRVHQGHRDRAHLRLRNVVANGRGDTVLITSEFSDVIPDPPTYRWTIEGIVYQCVLPTTE